MLFSEGLGIGAGKVFGAETAVRGRWTVLLALGSTVALVGLVLLLVQPSPAGSLAQLNVIDAAVEVKIPERGKFDQVGSGAPLAEGSVIRTDRTGLASIAYADGSLTRIGPSSTYELVRLRTEERRREIVGSLDTGQTFHRVSKVTGSGSRFEVHTSKAVAAVRGTAFAVQCFTSVTCEVGVTEGTVGVITPAGREVRVPAGRRVMVGADGELGEIKPLSQSDEWIAANADLDAAAPAETVPTTTDSDGEERLALSDPDDEGDDDTSYGGRSSWSGERTSSSSEQESSTDNSSGADPTTTTTADDDGPNDTQPRRTTSAGPTGGSTEPDANSAEEPTTTTAAPTTTTTAAPTTTTTAAPTTTTTAAPTTTTTRPPTTTTAAPTTTTAPADTTTTTTATAESSTTTTTAGGGDRATTTTTQAGGATSSTTSSTTSTTVPTTSSSSTTKPPCPHGRDREDDGNCGAESNGRSDSASSSDGEASSTAKTSSTQTFSLLWLFGFLFGGTVYVRRDPSSWEE